MSVPFAHRVACLVSLSLASVDCDSVCSVLIVYSLASQREAYRTSAAIAAAVRGSLFTSDGVAPSVLPPFGVGE